MARRRRFRRFRSFARKPVIRLPIQGVVTIAGPAETATTLLMGVQNFQNNPLGMRNVDIRGIFLKIVASGVVAAGIQAVRIVCGLLFHDQDTAGNFGMDFDLTSSVDTRQAWAWYPRTLHMHLTTDEAAGPEQVAMTTFKGPPTAAYRRHRGHESLIMPSQVTLWNGSPLTAGSQVSIRWEGALLVGGA